MIAHHPSDDTLARYAAGTLEAAPALVVAAHLESCPACRKRIGLFEKIGGALFDDLPPVAMAEDALERALARIERPQSRRPAEQVRAPRTLPGLPAGVRLPQVLRDCEIGPWRWGGPGIRRSRVNLPGSDAHAMLLHIGPGRKMPHHGHTGAEYTLILKGSFSDANGSYNAGDLCETDSDIEHQPRVGDEDCICLIAMEGRLQFHGFMTRLFEPFMRM